MKKKVAIVDYGLGNIVSAQQSFIKDAKENKLNVDVVITNEIETINNATHIVLPGQGAFKSCIEGLKSIDGMFRTDLPPVRTGKDGKPGYDEVLSRTHNPFEMRTLAEQLGLVDIEILFYHYHALPPMLEASIPKTFRASSLELESPRDWRGHFLASAFILKATKA